MRELRSWFIRDCDGFDGVLKLLSRLLRNCHGFVNLDYCVLIDLCIGTIFGFWGERMLKLRCRHLSSFCWARIVHNLRRRDIRDLYRPNLCVLNYL